MAAQGYAEIVQAWEERRQLAALLARNDADGTAALAAWRESTPPVEADDQLAAVMEDTSGGLTNAPGKSLANFLLFAFIIFFPMLASFAPILLLVGLPLYLPLGIYCGVMSFRNAKRQRPARFRAAALLAASGDDRALPTLIDFWLSGLPNLRRRDDKTEDMEAVLSSLLLTITARADGGRELRHPTRVHTALKRFVNGALSSPPHPTDLSERRTDAIIAALLILERSATAKDSPLLRRVAKMSGAGVNRSLLREVAAQLLDPSAPAEITAARVAAVRPTIASTVAPGVTAQTSETTFQHVGRKIE